MVVFLICVWFFFFQAEDGIRDAQESRGLGDVYKRQQLDLLARLGDRDAVVRSVGAGRRLLAQALAGRRVLLVVDDVWSTAAAAAFRVTGPTGRVLYTSRDRQVLIDPAVDARVE